MRRAEHGAGALCWVFVVVRNRAQGSRGQGRTGVEEDGGGLAGQGHLVGMALSSAELFETVRLPKCKSDQL